MKMCELFKARYSDGRTVYEKTLDYIYQHQNGARVEISPCIWVWKASAASVYFVDYVGGGIGCTVDTFDTLKEAEAFRETLAQMEAAEFESWLLNHWKQRDEARKGA